MQYLGLGVRRNWREQDQAIRAEYDRRWRSLLWIGVISGLVVLTAQLIAERYWPWAQTWLITGHATFLFGVVLWKTVGQTTGKFSILDQHPQKSLIWNEYLSAGLLLLLSFFLAGMSAPSGLNRIAFADGRILGAFLVPVCTFGLLSWSQRMMTARRGEVTWKTLKLTSLQWKLEAVVGALAGMSLGSHAWLVTLLIENFHVQIDVLHLIWVVFIRVGMLAPVHELFVRGLAFEVIKEGKQAGLLRLVFSLAILDFMIGLPIIFSVPDWSHHFLLSIYWLAYSLMAVFLRLRHDSLLVTWSSNLFFALFLEVLLR